MATNGSILDHGITTGNESQSGMQKMTPEEEKLIREVIAFREETKKAVRKKIEELDSQLTDEQKAEREKMTEAAIKAFRISPHL